MHAPGWLKVIAKEMDNRWNRLILTDDSMSVCQSTVMIGRSTIGLLVYYFPTCSSCVAESRYLSNLPTSTLFH